MKSIKSDFLVKTDELREQSRPLGFSMWTDLSPLSGLPRNWRGKSELLKGAGLLSVVPRQFLS